MKNFLQENWRKIFSISIFALIGAWFIQPSAFHSIKDALIYFLCIDLILLIVIKFLNHTPQNKIISKIAWINLPLLLTLASHIIFIFIPSKTGGLGMNHVVNAFLSLSFLSFQACIYAFIAIDALLKIITNLWHKITNGKK